MTPFLLLLALNARADDRIEVAVDPRVELVSVVCRLAGYPEYNSAPDSPWLQAVDAQFGPFKDHSAVREAAKLREKRGIGYNAPVDLALHLDPETFQPLVPLTPLPRRLDSRWDGKHAAKYAEQLARFASDSDFESFLDRQVEAIDDIESRYRRWVAKLEIIGWFDGMFGPVEGATYTLHPGLLLGPHNYGSSVLLPDGSVEIRPVLGVAAIDERGLPDIGDDPPWVLVHEVAHAYVNPLFARHKAQLAPGAQALFRKVASPMKAQAYGDWKTVANESGVRAATVLFAKDNLGDEAVGATAARELDAGFAWILPLTAALDAYRTDHTTGLEGFPAVAGKVFKDWASDPGTPPYLGPLNAMIHDEGTVFILPEATDDPASSRASMYAMMMHEKFWAEDKVGILTVDDAPKAKGKRRVFYGTLETNPPLADLLSRLNWTVGPDGVSLGARRFTGEGLALIATFVDPEGGLPVTVYTSYESAEIEGINEVFHGPTDWVIAKRNAEGAYQIEASGNFPKSLDGRWSNPAEVMNLGFDLE